MSTPSGNGLKTKRPASRWGLFLARIFGRGAGKEGADEWEELAARYLAGKGYRIAARNVRTRRGEIDIVAEDGETVVFVEVKKRSSAEFGGGEYAIGRAKQRKLVSAAKEFLAREKAQRRVCRFDAVIIQTGGGKPQVDHIENAFGEYYR